MRTVFADTGYWIAMTNPRDELHQQASIVTAQLGDAQIITSQMVLVEFLNFMGRRGEQLRKMALTVVGELAKDPNVEIIPQSCVQFDSAVTLFSSRLDKTWSLTDCASFAIMKERNIPEALANDHDFEQAGFIPLLRPSNFPP